MLNSGPDPWSYLRSLPTAEPSEDLLFRIFVQRRRVQRRQRRIRRLSIAASLLLVATIVGFLPVAGPGGDTGVESSASLEPARGSPVDIGAVAAVERAIVDAHFNGASARDIAQLQELQLRLAATGGGVDQPIITLM